MIKFFIFSPRKIAECQNRKCIMTPIFCFLRSLCLFFREKMLLVSSSENPNCFDSNTSFRRIILLRNYCSYSLKWSQHSIPVNIDSPDVVSSSSIEGDLSADGSGLGADELLSVRFIWKLRYNDFCRTKKVEIKEKEINTRKNREKNNGGESGPQIFDAHSLTVSVSPRFPHSLLTVYWVRREQKKRGGNRETRINR